MGHGQNSSVLNLFLEMRGLWGFGKMGNCFLRTRIVNWCCLIPPHELKNLGIHASKRTMQITAYVESLVPTNGRSEHEERIIRWPAGACQIDIEHKDVWGTTTKVSRFICMPDREWLSHLNCGLESWMSLIV